MPQHFVAPPQWEWYIVWYFFLGGLAGGAYLLGTILRLDGRPRDRAVARLAFLIAFPALAICPILLTLDLGRPLRFWHMLIDSRTFGLNFKYWSPMSVGAWVLIDLQRCSRSCRSWRPCSATSGSAVAARRASAGCS